MSERMTQQAPYPTLLAELVETWRYRPGWSFWLHNVDRGQGSEGLTLDVITQGFNSYHRPKMGPWDFGPGDTCIDCGEPFPCQVYAVNQADPESPRSPYRVHHFMPVPPASYNRASWQRWLFEQCLLIERHEASEFFEIDGERPYAPNHGPGWDPYIVTELTTDVDRRTSFRGVVKES